MTALLHLVLALLSLGWGGLAPAPRPIQVTVPKAGARVGTLVVPRLRLRAPVAQGAETPQLAVAVGHLPSSYLPGMGGTIALFGHDVTPWRGRPHGPFYDLSSLHRGDRLTFRVPWGAYRYRVIGRRIVSERDWAAFRPRLGRERLLLATCWPRYTSLERYVVIARLVG